MSLWTSKEEMCRRRTSYDMENCRQVSVEMLGGGFCRDVVRNDSLNLGSSWPCDIASSVDAAAYAGLMVFLYLSGQFQYAY